MRTILFSIGSVNIYGYGLMIALGLVAAFTIGMRMARSFGLNEDVIFNAALIGVVAGLIGAKVMYWIVEWDEMMADPSRFLALDSGFVVIGGLVAGAIAPVIYVVCFKHMDVLGKFDVGISVVPLAQAFGRIGCLLAGCCYGAEAPEGAWYALHFPAGSAAPTGVGLYPTQLLSSAGDFVIFLILVSRITRNKYKGQNLALFMMLYSIGRFLIEYLRADDRGDFIGPFSPSQFMSLIIFAGGILLWFIFKKIGKPSLKKLEKPAEAKEEQATA